MAAIYYIGKRTLFDILRTPVFWVTLLLAGFICFAILFWGWHQVQWEIDHGISGSNSIQFGPDFGEEPGSDTSPGAPNDSGANDESGPDSIGRGGGGPYGDQDMGFDPLANIKPEVMMLWFAYGITIGLGCLLGIYVMLGLIGKELERRTIELLISRPVTRTQIYLGKLIGGWVSLVIFMIIMGAWSLLSMQIGGMGIQKGYIVALTYGTLGPIFISTISFVLSLWMHWILAGFLGTVINFGASTAGLLFIQLLGVQVLKMKWPVLIIYKILPPMNVIGQQAIEHLQTDTWSRFVKEFFGQMAPSAADGVYTQMWHVYVYFAVILIIGWLSFFRRQFS
ncbi:MAG: ABC transporter permease subunit [bacterium]|nr:ABC transporter permease subunit [bacterium]